MNITIRNFMTGSGFDKAIFGEWSIFWLGLVVLFFMCILGKRWVGEEAGVGWNVTLAFVGAFLPYLILITVGIAVKWCLLAGIIGCLVGGLTAAFGFDFGNN